MKPFDLWVRGAPDIKEPEPVIEEDAEIYEVQCRGCEEWFEIDPEDYDEDAAEDYMCGGNPWCCP